MSTIKGLGPTRPASALGSTPSARGVADVSGAAASAVHEDLAVFNDAATAIASGAISQQDAVRNVLSAAISKQLPGLSSVARNAVAERLEALVLQQPELMSQLDQLLG